MKLTVNRRLRLDTLRNTAYSWHGGQFTAMYAFASTGTILPGLTKEALESMNEALALGKKVDANRLQRISELENKIAQAT